RQLAHGLIGAVGNQHMVAGPQVADQRHGNGRQAGGEQARAIGAFQLAYRVFKGERGGRAPRAIRKEPVLAAPFARLPLVRGVPEHHGAGPHNGRVDRRPAFVRRRLANARQSSFYALCPRHVPFTLFDNAPAWAGAGAHAHRPPAQSTLAPASLTTCAQRWISSRSCRAKSSGVLATTSLPPSTIRRVTSGERSVRTMASCR